MRARPRVLGHARHVALHAVATRHGMHAPRAYAPTQGRAIA